MDCNLLYELDCGRSELFESILARHRHELESGSRWRLDFLDSFDWRLFRKGLVLRFEHLRTVPPQGALCLSSLDGTARQGVRARKAPSFAADLPRSALRQRINRILGERRLLVMATIEFKGTEARILDKEGKTVLRLFAAEGVASSPELDSRIPTVPILELRPVKGYRQVFKKLRDDLRGTAGVQRFPGSMFEFALNAVGRKAGDYSAAVSIGLEADQSVEEATSIILQSQFVIVKANWKGVRQDWDPEFLHDLRVATRRVRSLLGQFKEVLPFAGFKRLRKDLKWIGRVTGPKRDIDVYLSTLASYDKVFPSEVVKGLRPLRDYLLRRQQEERETVAKALGSGRYRRLVSNWEAAIEVQDRPISGVPIAKIAAARIIGVHRRILSAGEEIGDRFDPQRLHALRIECKQLRYLLEFFRTLFGPKVLGHLIKELKRLQDVLGAINDLQVQQQNLQRYAKAMVSEDVSQTATLLNMGRLLGHFETCQVSLFPEFRESLKSFSQRAVRTSLTDGLLRYLEDAT